MIAGVSFVAKVAAAAIVLYVLALVGFALLARLLKKMWRS